MKRAAACILIPLFFFNGILSQLCKLPSFVAHYNEHRISNHDLSFADFVEMHYFGDDHNDQDNDRDMELPFKKTDDSSSFSVLMAFFSTESVIHDSPSWETAEQPCWYLKKPLDPNLMKELRPPQQTFTV